MRRRTLGRMHNSLDDVSAPRTYQAALDMGLSPAELRGPLWEKPWRGVRIWAGTEMTPRIRAQSAGLLLPDDGETGAVGGWGAAHLLGATEIDGLAANGVTPLPVPLYPTHRLRPRPGIVLWRSQLTAGDVVTADGVRVTSAERTAFDLGRRARGVRDCVVTLDQVLRCLDLPLDQLVAYTERHRRWRGVPLLRAAFPLVNPRSRSRPESRLRLVWILDAGLPVPQVNPELSDGRGRLLGLPDLLEEGTGLVGEYDGGQHRELGNHTADNAREEAFEREGLTVVRATSLDLGGIRLVRRLRAGHADAARRPRGTWVSVERPLRR